MSSTTAKDKRARENFERASLGQVRVSPKASALLIGAYTWADRALKLGVGEDGVLTYQSQPTPRIRIVMLSTRITTQLRVKAPRRTCLAWAASRTFSSKPTPVDLAFDKHVPPNGNETETPLVIMHGLLYVSCAPQIISY